MHQFWYSLKLICLLISIELSAQPLQVWKYDEYINQVIEYHPQSEEALLNQQMANGIRLEAKGTLDPVMFASWNQKNFDQRLYYQLYQVSLTVPTRLGLELIAGFENTRGDFLNPEDKTAPNGLWSLGVQADVLQGLIINERQTKLKQVEIYQSLAKINTQVAINTIVFAASETYLTWQKYYLIDSIYNENIQLANRNLESTKTSYRNGEMTAIDTLEAFIAYQDAIFLKTTNQGNLNKSIQELENYIWNNNNSFDLNQYQPQSIDIPLVRSELGNPSITLDNNPSIQQTQLKINLMDVGLKLKKEKLKPKLKVKYIPLLRTNEHNISPNFSWTDYKWGFDFSTPILWRSARGSILQTETKINQTQLQLVNKTNVLNNKMDFHFQQQSNLLEQIRIQTANNQRYLLLLQSEQFKFNFGEFSVFLLNKRQEKYIQGQIKLTKLKYDYQLNTLILRFLQQKLYPFQSN